MPNGRSPEESNLRTDCSLRSRKRKADVAIHLQDPDEEVAQIEMSRKKQYEQASWENGSCRSPHLLIPTPEKDYGECRRGFSPFDVHRFTPVRASPLPILGFGSKDVVWKNMVLKEHTYVRDKHFMQRHPHLQPKMRAILLDWLMEVCEVYKLHRETFYLAQDFFDRFMSTEQDVLKTRLQLIGISALFIAAKLEEIYPPKLVQFAYVTDGACTDDDILQMELIILKSLGWSLSPLTIVSWLNIYMQVAYLKEESCEVLLPQYPQQIFVQITELLDICVLDLGCLEFTYSALAASAFYYFSSMELVAKVSGYSWNELAECTKWMSPFALTIKEAGVAPLRHFRGVAPEDMHNIQTHKHSLDLLDKAQAKQAILAEANRTSPVPSGVLTPPQSEKKQRLGMLEVV